MTANAEKIDLTHAGRVGLALSGGGFRASLFHIGVLARLAELDLLKSVTVLSTVSGGSIIGAYYYLKVKELLEGKRKQPYQEPGREAYLQIVKEIERDFLAAVQKNIRMRTFLNPVKNAMMLREDYSRSDHIAELYRDYFYGPLWANSKNPDQSDKILLQDLKINPKPELMPQAMRGQPFDVFAYNAQAEFKIPILTINATTLNTGHSWHFTSSWVGEPKKALGRRQIDSHRILEQLRFDDETLTEKQKKKLDELTLGDAVAASACVPGLFHPLAIHDLYQNSEREEIVVQLVDGGVFDNQGLAALFTAGCTHIICSDASGQMEDELAPSIQFYHVLKRSNDILMDRVRDDGLQNLFLRERGYQLLSANNSRAGDDTLRQELAQRLNVREFAFFYLKDSFPESPGFPCLPGPVDKRTGMIYCLSQLRTDLDSFTDLEAYALMYDGYCLSGEHLTRQKELGATVASVGQPREQWNFLKIREVLSRSPEYLLKHLRVGKQTALKVFLLREPIACCIALLLVLAVIPFLWWSRNWTFNGITNLLSLGWAPRTMTLGQVYIAIFFVFLSFNHTIKKMLKQIRWLRRLKHGIGVSWLYLGVPVLFALVVSVVVAIHLAIFDRLFLRSGRIKQVPAGPQASPGVPSPVPTAGL